MQIKLFLNRRGAESAEMEKLKMTENVMNLPAKAKENELIVIKALRSSIEVNDVSHISDHVFELLESGQKYFVFDLEGVSSLSCAAAALLLVVKKKAVRTGGDLTLVGLSEEVLEIFDLFGVRSELQVEEEVSNSPRLELNLRNNRPLYTHRADDGQASIMTFIQSHVAHRILATPYIFLLTGC